MRITVAMRLSVSVPLGVFLFASGAACVDSLGSDGQLLGLNGGETVDAAAGLAPQNPPGPASECTAAGKPGQPCTMAITCCGVTQGSGICNFNGR
jgi:hypothetical protein